MLGDGLSGSLLPCQPGPIIKIIIIIILFSNLPRGVLTKCIATINYMTDVATSQG